MYRKVRRLALAVALAMTAGLMLPGLGRAQAQEAKITGIVLDVRHRVGADGQWVKSKVGSQLPADSRVRTARRSKCELKFPDGSIIRMGERSDLVIKRAVNVELSHGRLYARIVAGTVARVTGASGVAAVKGTEFEYLGMEEEGDLGLPPNLRHEILRVYAGEVLFSGESGMQTLRGETASQIMGTQAPTTPVAAPPAQFPGGERQQWWAGVSSGVQVSATPGGPVGAEINAQRLTQRYLETQVIPPPQEGALEVVVTSLGASQARGVQPRHPDAATGGMANYGSFPGVDRNNALASAAAPLGALTLDAIAEATTGQLEGGTEVLGKRFFGPRAGIDTFGFWAEGTSMLGALGRTSAVWDEVYVEVSGLTWTKFDGVTSELAESYVAMRPDWGEIVLGRQRFLDGPINNTPVGSLLSFDLADAIRADYQAGNRLKLTGAYLEDFSPLLDADTSGTLLRAEYSAFGGTFGGSWLHQSGAGDEAWMFDFALSAVPDSLDAYCQLGEDPMGREFGTAGVYFPELYQSSGVDMFIEYAWRDNLPSVTSLRAYRPLGNFDTVFMLQKEAGGASTIGIGAVLHSGD